MPKKIYDIKPPKLVRKAKEDGQKAVSVNISPDAKKNKKVVKQKKESKSIFNNPWTLFIIGFVAILLIVGVYLYIKLPKVDVTIWPNVETLSFQQTLTIDKEVESTDISRPAIPAQYFEVTKTNSQDFPATGNASNEGKATGNIVIYNKVDPPTSFTFKVGTRFLSDSGKLFITYQKVVIPAAKKVGSKITPGSVQIQVQAAEGGSDYNIAPSNFSIPGLKGTSSYYNIYATSTEAMTGGYSGKVKKVTADDILGAKEVLIKKTEADAISDLKAQIPSEYIILDDAIVTNVTKASTQTKADAIVENFNYSATVSASTLAFKKSDLDKYVKDYIVSQIPEGKTLLQDDLKVSYSAGLINLSGGKIILNLDFSSGVYKGINKNAMGLSLLGKNASQIREIVTNSMGEEISKIEIKFWPFWVSSAPNNQKVVNIDLKFE